MIDLIRPLADAWAGRYAHPSPEALAAVRGLSPATVVTGGSRGIGLALARRFAAARSDVILVARGREALDNAAAAVARDCGVKALALPLDITASDAAAEIDRTAAAHGLYVDHLVNNAGIGLAGPFHGLDPSDIERLVGLNVTALTRLMRHYLVPMRARGRGGILNVASLGGYVPGPYQAAYYASKAYVISLTEAVAHETRGEGVRVAVVSPGPVETGFHEAMGAKSALYRLMVPSSSAERVARIAYRGFVLGRRVIVPGGLGTLAVVATRLVPHLLLVPLIGTLLYPGPEGGRAKE